MNIEKEYTVLSLCDGMSCGQIALNKVGIKNYTYYASEIDKYAMKVTQHNYPNTIQIGDITKVSYKDGILYTENGEFNIGKVDLLLSGTPCQGFSSAGRGLNFEDPRSKLFFEFVRIKTEIEETNPKLKYLFENVKPRKKEWLSIFTGHIGVEPILIDSALVSAQSRKRYYWSNISNVTQPTDKEIYLKDIIDFDCTARKYVDLSRIKQSWETKNYYQYDLSGKGHKSQDQRAYYLNGKHGTIPSRDTQSKVKVLLEGGEIITLTPKECERLQTVPNGFTSCVSDSKAYSMLGNGWTIDIITHFFKKLNFNIK